MSIAISVVIPCRNEGQRIAATLDDLASQDAEEPFEVIVADGSDDPGGSGLTARSAAARDPFRLLVVANPERIIPAALNRAVGAASGDLIVRIDAHARLPRDYIRCMATHLRTPGVDVVGPQIFAVPGSPDLTARIISWCQNTRLGNGGTPARNRLTTLRRVRHSPMSCYRRAVWVQIGGYDEALLSNEDFDFDWRAGQAGFAVHSAPAPRYQIIARASLPALAQQRWRYGRWKGAVAWRHPGSLSLRQLIPPLTLLAGVAFTAAWAAGMLPPWIPALAALSIPGCALGLVRCSRSSPERPSHIQMRIREVFAGSLIAAIAYATIHMVWAAGFLRGIATGPVHPRRRDGC